VSIEDLRVRFSTSRGTLHAVDGVSLQIPDGQTVGLVGETGSGKSVTARSLLRLVPRPPGRFAGGRILFRPKQRCPRCAGDGCADCDGQGRIPISCRSCDGAGCPVCDGSGREVIDLLTIPDRRMREIRGNRIAMIFQDPGKALNPGLPIRRQLAEVFAYHRAEEILRDAGVARESTAFSARLLRRAAGMRSRTWERALLDLPPLRAHARRLDAVLDERIAGVLSDTRISNPAHIMQSYPHELSGGMKQRVMIAQALACDPDLMIADEPTTALDVTIQARILELIQELQQRHRMSVLYVSHDLSLVRRICHGVAVMYGGRVVELGPADDVFAEPMHPYTRGLLAAVPTRGHRRGGLQAIEGNVPEFIDPSPSCRFESRCPHATRVCRERDPELKTKDARGRHHVACFLYDEPAELGVASEAMPNGEVR